MLSQEHHLNLVSDFQSNKNEQADHRVCSQY